MTAIRFESVSVELSVARYCRYRPGGLAIAPPLDATGVQPDQLCPSAELRVSISRFYF